MNFKILYVSLAVLTVIVLFGFLVAREVAIIEPKLQGNNRQEIAILEEHEEYLPYDFSSSSQVEKRFSITVVKRLPKEKPLPTPKKQEIKETPQVKQVEQADVASNQTAVIQDNDSKQPDSEEEPGSGLPTLEERKDLKKRGIVMF